VLFVLPDSYVDPDFKDYGGTYFKLLLLSEVQLICCDVNYSGKHVYS
jgi:hypothetical protein